MPKDRFEFKQFAIQQDRCAMKVGTDGVLLGAWVNVKGEGGQNDSTTIGNSEGTTIGNGESITIGNSESLSTYHVLDIGTGTGIIALMLAQRLSAQGQHFHIEAIEIDPSAAQQAADNFLASPWSEHLTIHPQSLADFALQPHNLTTFEPIPPSTQESNFSPPLTGGFGGGSESGGESSSFALILSNPPFYDATLKPDDVSRAVARHKDSLPVADIARYAATHLSPRGRLALIYPTAYDAEVMTATVLAGLHPIRLCDILTKQGRPCKRRMAEFSAAASPLLREQLIIRGTDGSYTAQYRLLTDPYYLHLAD